MYRKGTILIWQKVATSLPSGNQIEPFEVSNRTGIDTSASNVEHTKGSVFHSHFSQDLKSQVEKVDPKGTEKAIIVGTSSRSVGEADKHVNGTMQTLSDSVGVKQERISGKSIKAQTQVPVQLHTDTSATVMPSTSTVSDLLVPSTSTVNDYNDSVSLPMSDPSPQSSKLLVPSVATTQASDAVNSKDNNSLGIVNRTDIETDSTKVDCLFKKQQSEKKTKSTVSVHHCDIIGDQFWRDYPHILNIKHNLMW